MSELQVFNNAEFGADQKKNDILASVSLAQFILESGYGKIELAQNANHLFGMKKSLSGNSWNGSAWDGKSVYSRKTQEQNADGSYETITRISVSIPALRVRLLTTPHICLVR